MTGPIKRHIARLCSSSEGSVAVFVGLFLVAALGAGVMVVDYTRASTLQGKLQHAMDTSVGEAARGQSDAQVIALAKAQIGEFLKDGNYASVDEAVFTITRENGRVTLSGTLPYSPLFGPLYGLVSPAGNLLVASGSTAREAVCTPLAAERRWSAKTGACVAGQTGSHTWEAEEERTSSCAAGALEPSWSGWVATGAVRGDVNSCVASTCTWVRVGTAHACLGWGEGNPKEGETGGGTCYSQAELLAQATAMVEAGQSTPQFEMFSAKPGQKGPSWARGRQCWSYQGALCGTGAGANVNRNLFYEIRCD